MATVNLNDFTFAVGRTLLIRGVMASDTFNAGPGDDTIFGLDGDDIINGSDGDDMLFGNAGKDSLNGGPGDDLLARRVRQ